MNRLDKSELIFKIIAYVVVTLFAISTLYPLIFTLSSAVSSKEYVEAGKIYLFPIDADYKGILAFFNTPTIGKDFWISYTNTLFYAFYGTMFSMILTIFAAYALSKRNLLFKSKISFFIVFTMWFSAGIMPMYYNYKSLGVVNRWGIIYGFGLQAFNIMLLRNYFNGIPKEIEEAATIDGASEFNVLKNIYLPMSKSSLATITLFYALNRWNGYFWNMRLVEDSNQWPLQVVLRKLVAEAGDTDNPVNYDFSLFSVSYAAIVLSIIPIIIIYPYLQRYFAQGVNVGGVKE